ncbi:camphor resistance protein CrcB [Rhodopseudomonas palustris HaA2]|uniref:Fluoride-specific ion channel FluC n=1 Tax=Rhodopseudomonas palustris (strain HaA2) TaxID=316058 RepID=Q2IVV9_RHOP2|nr:fluoride efflux transporter CrcB [Rhodopseudomonas palustris]ABD07651.1 camphor resistance protein CrcB [Rhodopseudomonas palustris HaA2]
MDIIYGAIWVALGSMFGGVARFGISGFVARTIGETFPWGTLTVNATGALAIGILGGLANSGHGLLSQPAPWLFAVTGFLGCYTTVSSFSLQTLTLAREGERWRAIGNVAISLILCLGLAAIGFMLATGDLP